MNRKGQRVAPQAKRLCFRGGVLNKAISLALLALLVPLLGQGRPAEEIEKGEEEQKGGWMVAGRTVGFAPDETSPAPPGGRLESYCSARIVYELLAAADTLWIGTEGGLFAYAISRDSIFQVQVPIPGTVEALALDDAGSLWVGGGNGLCIRSGGRWSRYTDAAHSFYARIEDISSGESGMWLASFGSGAGLIEDGDLTIFTREDSLLDDRVLRIIEQEGGTVWFGTASGVCRADTASWETMRYGSNLPIGSVNDMLLDEEGSLFLAIARQGVALYNLGRVRKYGLGRGLPDRDVNGFSLDPAGTVWAAGRSGVSMMEGSNWSPYRITDIPIGRYNYTAIHHGIGGECYLGTDEGKIIVFGREMVKEILLPQGFPERTICRLRISGGRLWAVGAERLYSIGAESGMIEPPDEHYRGTLTDVCAGEGAEIWVSSRFGLLHHDGSTWEVFDRRQGLPTEQFERVARDGEGRFWFQTYEKGILKLTGDTWVHYSTASGLPDDRIEDLIVDKNGEPWILTLSGEVARFRGGRWETLALPVEQHAPIPDSDSVRTRESFIRFISARGEGKDHYGGLGDAVLGLDGLGNCIVACDRGIFRFTGADWQVIDIPDGLGELGATAVLGTSRGTIWVGTEGNGIFIRSRGGWRRLGTDQGLFDDHIESLCEDASGSIWIGTRSGGLSRFMPGRTTD